MIPQRNISLLSNRLASEGGRRIREDVLERDYCLAWFLAVLSRSDLKPVLGFKGGTALKRCYFPDYRFSEDLDFTLLEAQRRGSVDRWATGTIPLQHRNYPADRSPDCDTQANFCANTSPQGGASMSPAKKRRGHIGDTLSCFLLLLERHPVRPRPCDLSRR